MLGYHITRDFGTGLAWGRQNQQIGPENTARNVRGLNHEDTKMARAQLKCTCPECGTTHYWQVNCYNRREADSWEEYHAGDTDRLCPECYRKMMTKKREEERAEENKAAAATAAALNLPALTGTEKQIAWATTIRQAALDGALQMIAGRTSASLTEKGRALVSATLARMSTDAQWWINNRDGAEHRVSLEIETANWARLDDATRAAKLAAAKKDSEASTSTLKRHIAEKYLCMERARIAGRTYSEQYDADKAEAEAKRLAALPPKPATLAARLGRPNACWNQKFYGRDGLRVYLDGDEVQVPAAVKSAWEAEWREYNAATRK